MKISTKFLALGALLASGITAAPIEQRDANSDIIAGCFLKLFLTGKWSGTCAAAVAVDLGLIKSIAVNDMSMDFTTADPYKPIVSSTSVVATMLGLPGINLPINKIRQHIILSDGDVALGSFDTAWSAASVHDGKLTTSFAPTTMTIFPNAKAAFSTFVESLSNKAEHPVTLKGSIDAILKLPLFGEVEISGIGLKQTVPFAGLDGLKNIQYLYFAAYETSDYSNSVLFLSSILKINNPSKLTLTLGDLTLNTETNGSPLGPSTLSKLKLVPGDNYVLASTTADVMTPAGQHLFFGLGAYDIVLNMSGFNGTSANPVLSAGLLNLRNSLTIPTSVLELPLSQAPISDISLKLTSTSGTDRKIELTASFGNPYFGIPIEIVQSAGGYLQGNFQVDTAKVGAGSLATLVTLEDTVHIRLDGNGRQTVTFSALINRWNWRSQDRPIWTKVVDYANANGHIPVNINWTPNVVFNDQGNPKTVDWASGHVLGGSVNVAVESNFNQVLSYIPA